MKLLLYSCLIGLVLGFCYLWVTQESADDFGGGASGKAVGDVAAFSEMVRFQVNLTRHAGGLPNVGADPAADEWVKSKLPDVLENSATAMDAVLAGLQAEMPTVHTAAAYLTLADDERELVNQVEQWHQGIGTNA
ncbi:MAG: hypothetical protein O3C21_08200, partial [Verrucomicrobia bacterium]|nr:hypothetical protein [Verrucomicrobiota bacterium]